MTGSEEENVALKLLHTADWHLGMRFRSFDEEGQKKLMRARLDVIDRILGVAQRYQVDAVLCAGDLFDSPEPERDWWHGLAERFAKQHRWPENRPVFLLPGNHDPLTHSSVYSVEHPFQRELPDWVHIVDRPGFVHELSSDAVLYANPCLSSAGQDDLALALPDREPGDERIRIGLVHGRTFEMNGVQNDFPIAIDAAERCGLDYLAVGDTHGFRRVTSAPRPPIIYPGTPEPTAFDEKEPGHVALVFFRRGRRPRVEPVPVGHWVWEDHPIADMDALRALCARSDLDKRVLRLRLDMAVTLDEQAEIERLERQLAGTDASQGKVGVLQVERNLRLRIHDQRDWTDELPDILRTVVERLESAQDQDREVIDRAIAHLYRLVQQRRGTEPGARS